MKLIKNKSNNKTVFDLFLGVEDYDENSWSSTSPALWEKEKKTFSSSYIEYDYVNSPIIEFFTEKKYLSMKLKANAEYRFFCWNVERYGEEYWGHNLICNLYVWEDFFSSQEKTPLKTFEIQYCEDWIENLTYITPITLENDTIVVLELVQNVVDDYDSSQFSLCIWGEQPLSFNYNTRYYRNYKNKIDGTSWGIVGKNFDFKSLQQMERINAFSQEQDINLRLKSGIKVDYKILSEEDEIFSSFEEAKSNWGDYVNSPMVFDRLNIKRSDRDFTQSKPSIIKIEGYLYFEQNTSFVWEIYHDDDLAIRFNDDSRTDKFYSYVNNSTYEKINCNFNQGLNHIEFYLYDSGGDYFCYERNDNKLNYFFASNVTMLNNDRIDIDYYITKIKPLRQEYNIDDIIPKSNNLNEDFTLFFNVNVKPKIEEEQEEIETQNESIETEEDNGENNEKVEPPFVDFVSFSEESHLFLSGKIRKEENKNTITFYNTLNEITFSSKEDIMNIAISFQNNLFFYINGKNVGYMETTFLKRPDIQFIQDNENYEFSNAVVYDGLGMSNNAIYYVFSRNLI